jgi:hypothetical protein
MLLLLAFILAIPFQLCAGEAASRPVILSTTTSDELAAPALDIWAQEQGYEKKIELNLAGI